MGLTRARGVAAGLATVVVLSSWVGFASLERQELDPDEAMWIHVSQKTWTLFRTGAWDDPGWEAHEAAWGYLNPPVAKYLIGAALQLQGKQWEWRIGTPPPDDVLVAARRMSAAFGVLGCVGLFWIGLHTLGPAAGFLAAVALAISPMWAEASRRAMTDIHGASLSILALAALVPALSRIREARPMRGTLPWVAASGVLGGLAMGAKLNAGSTVALLGALLVLAHLRAPRRGPGAPALASVVLLSAVLAVTAAATFVGANPYLHPDPWGRLMGILDFWKGVSLNRAARAAERGDLRAFRPEDFGARVLFTRFVSPLRLPALVLLVPLGIAAASWALGAPARRIARRVVWPILPVAAGIVAATRNQLFLAWIPWIGLLAAGLAAISPDTLRARAARSGFLAAVAPLWLGIVAFAVWRATYWLHDRYYLPVLPACCLVAGWGLAVLRTRTRLVDAAVAAGVCAALVTFPDYDPAMVRNLAGGGTAVSRALHVASLLLLTLALAAPVRDRGPGCPVTGSARSSASPWFHRAAPRA